MHVMNGSLEVMGQGDREGRQDAEPGERKGIRRVGRRMGPGHEMRLRRVSGG